MTRIDHTGHDHPATTKARTACRAALAVGRVMVQLDDAPAPVPATIVEVREYDAYVSDGRGGHVYGRTRSYTLNVAGLGPVRVHESRVTKA